MSSVLAALVLLAAGVSTAATFPIGVRTEGGAVRGAVEKDLVVYRAIPYARPPVGELRWRPPQPAQAWAGTRDATRLASDCAQAPFGQTPPAGRHPVAEDCLYLNIWRPASDARKLPVMVWIHGGGFVNGGSSSPDSTGEGMAGRGVLFVSFNYRLGRFGFFGFPALNHERPEEAKGNYALMDQIAALQWIRRNIADFGGDAKNVTVVGESAGGMSINMLLTSPVTRGLFDRAIIQSGGGRDLVRRRMLDADLPNAPGATTLGLKFAASKGIGGDDAAALRKLRALSAQEIVAGLNMASLLIPDVAMFPGPVIDGRLLVDTPESIYAAGKQQALPIIIGTTSADLGWNRARSVEDAFAAFGSQADAARRIYDPLNDGDLRRINAAIGADRAMVEPARFIARSMSAVGAPVYAYRFSYVLASKRAASPWGAQHASDVPFAFDLLTAVHGTDVSVGDERVAAGMADYWAAFARSGDPNGAQSTVWPRYDQRSDVILDFAADGAFVAIPDPWRERLDLVHRRH